MLNSFLNVLSFLLLPAIIACPIAFAYFLLKHTSGRRMKQYKLLAQKYGLTIEGAKTGLMSLMTQPGIRGNYHNHEFRVGTYVERRGGSRHRAGGHTTYTYLNMILDREVPCTLTLVSETFFTKISEALGGHDIKTGDDIFDQHFRITSDNEAFAKALLSAPVRSQLVQTSLAGKIALKGNTLSYQEPKVMYTDTVRMSFENMIELFDQIAKSIEEKNRFEHESGR